MVKPEIWARDKIIDKIKCDRRDNSLAPLDPQKVPIQLRELIDYAEVWGIPDDGYREELVVSASPESLRNLADIFTYFEDALMDWLAGSEADAKDPTKEYVAFSVLLRAGDLARINLSYE